MDLVELSHRSAKSLADLSEAHRSAKLLADLSETRRSAKLLADLWLSFTRSTMDIMALVLSVLSYAIMNKVSGESTYVVSRAIRSA